MVYGGQPAPATANGEAQYVCEQLYVNMNFTHVAYVEQAQAHVSGSKATELLPPPMTHIVQLPAKYQKILKGNNLLYK